MLATLVQHACGNSSWVGNWFYQDRLQAVSLPVIAWLWRILPLEWTSMGVWNSHLGKMVRDSKAPTQNLGQVSSILQSWSLDGRWSYMAAHQKSLLMSPRGIRMVSSTSLEVGMETRSSMICFSAFAQPQSERGQRPWATEQNNNLSLSDLSSQRTWTAAYECMWEFLQWFWDDMLTHYSHDHFSLLTASFKAILPILVLPSQVYAGCWEQRLVWCGSELGRSALEHGSSISWGRVVSRRILILIWFFLWLPLQDVMASPEQTVSTIILMYYVFQYYAICICIYIYM